jgi:hypothetical protein
LGWEKPGRNAERHYSLGRIFALVGDRLDAFDFGYDFDGFFIFSLVQGAAE